MDVYVGLVFRASDFLLYHCPSYSRSKQGSVLTGCSSFIFGIVRGVDYNSSLKSSSHNYLLEKALGSVLKTIDVILVAIYFVVLIICKNEGGYNNDCI